MHRNVIPPLGVKGIRVLVIRKPEDGIFYYNGNFHLAFQKESEFHLTTTPQLTRLQSDITRGWISADMYKEDAEVLRKVRGGNTLTILLPFEEEQVELKHLILLNLSEVRCLNRLDKFAYKLDLLSSLLAQMESHKVASSSLSGTSQRSQTSTFNVNAPNRGNFQRSQTSTSFSRSSNDNRPNDNGNKRTARGFTLFYENYGFNVHTIDRCFKIIGYPADFRKRKAGFYESNGIVHQTSCSYTPQLNGIVKRKHKHHLNVATLPTSVLNGKSPYDLVYNMSPSLKHLRSFGCLAYATVLNSHDKFGPYKVTTKDGFRYFLTIVDDFSKDVLVYLLKSKTKVFYNRMVFYNFNKTEFKRNIKVFRSDYGTEFVDQQFKGFCESNGIVHQTSCSYTPQQNGIVKRKHKHHLNVATSFIFQEGIPLNMWTECILTATYLINRLPTSVLNGKSPYDLVYNMSPSLKHLRSFGCLAYATVLNSHDKFGSRSKKCVLVGYLNFKRVMRRPTPIRHNNSPSYSGSTSASSKKNDAGHSQDADAYASENESFTTYEEHNNST
nr:ribonuclease H-like domain-containing protein [Tanacetum cinerariifolium]